MNKHHTTKLLWAALGLLPALGGCAGQPAPADDLTQLQLEVTLVPPGAQCAVLTATPPAPATATKKSFPLVAGQTSVSSVSNLPTGTLTLTEDVFTVPCAMVTSTSKATWSAAPVTVNLQLGVPVSVSFTLHRNDQGGMVSIQTSFPGPKYTITEFLVPASPAILASSIATGPDGNLWVPDLSAHVIYNLTPSGTFTEIAIPNDNTPRAITAGPDGNMWFVDVGGKRIARLSPSGIWAGFPIPGPGAFGIPPLTGIATGPDGNLWFVEPFSSKVGRITPIGTITEFATPSDAFPVAVAAGPDGNVWFAEAAGLGKIGRITPAGVITEFPLQPGSMPPGSLTAGPDGNIWFTELASSKIGRITPAGVITEFSTPTPSSGPMSITLGRDGNLWFTEQAVNAVANVTTAGVFTELGVPTPSSAPTAITAGPDGNMWFVSIQQQRIGRVSF